MRNSPNSAFRLSAKPSNFPSAKEIESPLGLGLCFEQCPSRVILGKTFCKGHISGFSSAQNPHVTFYLAEEKLSLSLPIPQT